LAPDVTRIFLGEKWMPMVPAMQVLCIFGITRSIGATIGPILYSLGKPKIQTKLSTIQLIVMAAIIYPLTIQWGLLGVSLAVVMPNILILILITKELKSLIKLRRKDFFTSIIAAATGVFMMIFVAFFKHSLLLSTNDIFNFFMIMGICSSIYLMIIYLWDRKTGYKMWHEVQTVLSNLSWRNEIVCDQFKKNPWDEKCRKSHDNA
jgi:O-antigen/teichoic acid export membrane protein